MAESAYHNKEASPFGGASTGVTNDIASHGHNHSSHRRLEPAQSYAHVEGKMGYPGQWKPYEHRKFGNPAPLGLSAFALTTFVLSCVNMEARNVKIPDVVIPLAFGYGGLVQLLAGMWEMAVGNTFGATALSSFGGFWISYALLLTPSPWAITELNGPYEGDTNSAVGFFLTGWFIFTLLLVLCTLRTNLTFFLLFFFLDLAFLMLTCEHYAADNGHEGTATRLKKAGGLFGFLAAFLAWYHALAGIHESSNSFFSVPIYHFPWSDLGRERRLNKFDSDSSATA